MSKILHLFTFILISSSLSSCLLPNEKGKVSLSLSEADQAARDSATNSRASLSEVKLIDDQVVITGTNLHDVVKAKISQSGSDSTLTIISQTASELILSSSSKVALALNTLMSLTLEDAYGATVVEVTFNLPDSSVSTDKIGDNQVTTAKIADGTITAVKLDQMSAAVGQVLRWNGTSWAATDLDALTYAGTWDASVGGSPNPAAVGGEYYIVSANGTADPGDGDTRSWVQGDWIVFNDNSSTWNQISNSSDVTSFEGRTGGVTAQSGDYTWAMIDKSTSSIGDITDVDLSTPATNGKVLKFNGTSWVADDDLSGGGTGSVSSSEILDGSIVDADVSGSAAIAWGKINKTGAVASDVGLGNVTNHTQLKAADLDDTTTLGTSTTKVPTQNAVKTYVDNAVTGMGSLTSITGGAALTDGPYTTTGTIDVQVDNTTIEVATDALQVKALGIGSTQLAANAVTTAKINNSSVTNAKIDSVADTKITTACSDGEILSASSGNFVCASATSTGNWNLSGSDLYYNSGNVGIGNTSPASQLQVGNGVSIFSAGVSDNTHISRNLYFDGANYKRTFSDNEASLLYMGGSGKVAFYSNSDTLSATDSNITLKENFTILKNGNIGINNAAPQHLLNMKGTLSSALSGTVDVTSGTATVTGTATSFDTELRVGDAIQIASETFTVSAITSSTSLTLDSNHAVGASGAIAFSDPSLLSLNNGDGTNLLTVDKSGNLGLGLSSPTEKLDIDGALLLRPKGTSTGETGQVNFRELATNGSDAITLRSPDALAASYNLTLPMTSGNSGEVLTTDGSGSLSWAPAEAATSVSASAGAVGTPSMSFSTDTNTGFYSSGADQVGVSTNGVNTFNFTTTALSSPTTGGATITTDNGTAAAPTFSFAGDEDTGWFRAAPNELAASTTGSERIRIKSSGNVGIGTTSPSSKLDVDGEIHVKTKTVPFYGIKINDYADSSGLYLGSVSGGATRYIAGESYYYNSAFWRTDSTVSSAIHFHNGTIDFSTNTGLTSGVDFTPTKHMRIDSGGNVGIGTTAPSYKLDIREAGHGIKSRVRNSSNSFELGSGTNADSAFITGNNADLAFQVNNTEAMRIDVATGNIGIGTTSPGSKLDIQGSSTSEHQGLRVTNEVAYGSGTQLSSIGLGKEESSTWQPMAELKAGPNSISSSTSGYLSFYTRESSSTSEKVRISSSGNVGIGTTNPTQSLHLTAGTPTGSTPGPVIRLEINDNAIYTSQSLGAIEWVGQDTDSNASGVRSKIDSVADGNEGGTSLAFFTAANSSSTLNEILRISGNGNVGIGTTDPTTQLDVDGIINGTINSLDNRAAVDTPETLETRGVEFNFKNNTANGLSDGGTYNGVMTFRPYGNLTDWSGGPSHQLGFTQGGRLFHRSGSSTTWGSWKKIIEENSSGNVGIGTTSPASQLTLEGDATTPGSGALLFKQTGVGDGNGISMGLNKTTGNFSISDSFNPDSGEYLTILDTSGNVGIGTTGPSERLHVVGNLRVEGSTDCTLGDGAGATNCTSDQRLKNDITPINDALEKIKSVKGVDFVWNENALSPGKHSIGVIAQDIQKVFPTAVIENADGYLSVDYAVLVSPLIEAVKELDRNQKMFKLMQEGQSEQNSRRIASLEDELIEAEFRVEKLEIENQSIKAENQEIKKALCTISPVLSLCDRK